MVCLRQSIQETAMRQRSILWDWMVTDGSSNESTGREAEQKGQTE